MHELQALARFSGTFDLDIIELKDKRVGLVWLILFWFSSEKTVWTNTLNKKKSF